MTAPRPWGVSRHVLHEHLLYWAVFSSFLVMFDPSPHELVVSFGLVLLMVSNVRMPRFLAMLIVIMVALNASGVIAALPVIDKPKVLGFVLVSLFLAAATLFYAVLLSENTLRRLEILRRAWIVAGVLAALAGVLGYFNVAGLGSLFTAYGGTRAKATFNDPNVFGPFLIAPTLFLVQDLMAGRGRLFWQSIGCFLLLLGQFLSFSRASWGHLCGSLVIFAVLTVLTTHSTRLRMRFIVVGGIGLGIMALGLVILLSLESVSSVFLQRASLQQSYDVKSGGRFDNYLNALNVLFEAPFGIGPFEFAARFGEDVHNAYLNVFVSYGWGGGIAYLALVTTTLTIGVYSLYRANPLRPHMIALLACFLPLTIVSFIIHSDHWRHYFLLISAIWATAAASAQYAKLYQEN